MSWELKDIYKALNKDLGKIKNINFKNISIDSRTIKKNDLFIPICGKNFDGHNFINEVSKKGVKACLIEKNKQRLVQNKNIHKIIVNDTVESLKKLATYSREKKKNLTMICITGSTGKTSLKEWLGRVLEKKIKTYVSPGNFNNEIGMPLSLVNMPAETKICVLELGMNNYGEIKELTKISKPTISIITNIGLAHIGNFHKPEEIANEKSEIFSYLEENSFALIPRDSLYYNFLLKRAKRKTKNIISFGADVTSDSNFKKINNYSFLFSILGSKIILKKMNKFLHWEENVLIILCVLKILKLKTQDFLKFIGKLKPLQGRGQLLKITLKKKSFTLIDESYNSSPQSLKSAIFNSKELVKTKKNLILVIGDMLELGVNSKKMHLEILDVIKKVSPFMVITVGKITKALNENLPRKIKKVHYLSIKHLYERLIEEISDGDIVMIKGSNSINLSKICDKLKKA